MYYIHNFPYIKFGFLNDFISINCSIYSCNYFFDLFFNKLSPFIKHLKYLKGFSLHCLCLNSELEFLMDKINYN